MNKKPKKELTSSSKADLEQQKLIMEINELQRKSKWRIISIVAFILISIPMIWFYYKEFTEPIIQRDNIKLSLENEKRAEQLQQLEDIHRKELIDLETKRKQQEKEYLIQIKEKEKQQRENLKQLEQIRNEYQKMSSLYSAKTKESQELKAKVASLNNQIKDKEKSIEDLGENIKQAELRAKSRFRPTPTSLSYDDVKAMIIRNDFYDNSINKTGRGIDNQYTAQTIKGDKVVLDEATGLMWQQSGSSELMDYEKAKHWIIELNQKGYASYNDWRLPTLEEAMILMEPSRKDHLHIDPKFDRKQERIWTSDLVKDDSRHWIVFFNDGTCLFVVSPPYVRAVRSKQSSQK